MLAAFLPGFPLQVAVRANPSLEKGRAPFAVADSVVDGSGRREVPSGATLIAVSAAAWRAGARAGMTAAQGRAACPGLAVKPLDPGATEIARIAVAETLSGFGPIVEFHDAWTAGLVDVSGTRDELALAEEAAEALARAGVIARIAVASNRFTARTVATWGATRNQPRLVDDGGESEALRDLPVHALPLERQASEAFQRLGVRTLGDLARLPADTLARRFGGGAAAFAPLARGADASPLHPFRIPAALFERIDLGDAVSSLESLLFPLKTIFDRVCVRLVGRGRAAAKLALHLVLEEMTAATPSAVLELRLPKPTVAGKTLLEVARERMGNLTLPGPVREMAVEVIDSVPVRRTQLDLFSRAAPSPERLAVTLGRLASGLGDGAVFAAKLADEHRPEKAWQPAALEAATASVSEEMPAPIETAKKKKPKKEKALPPATLEPEAKRPVRVLAAPEPVTLVRRAADLNLLVRGRRLVVEEMEGPERLSGDWWDTPYDRDYFRVRTEEGSRWWIFHDRAHDSWHLHGMFD